MRGPSDWRLLAGASLLQVFTAFALRLVPVPALRRLFPRLAPLVALTLQGSEDRVIWALEATGRRLTGVSTCLVRALIVEQRFSSPDRPLRLMIGVRKPADGPLQSHAWVTDRQRILIGGASADQFLPLLAWEGLAS